MREVGQELAHSIHEWIPFSTSGFLPFIFMDFLAASHFTTTIACVDWCLPFFQMTNTGIHLLQVMINFILVTKPENLCCFLWLIKREFQFISFSFQPEMIKLKCNVQSQRLHADSIKLVT